MGENERMKTKRNTSKMWYAARAPPTGFHASVAICQQHDLLSRGISFLRLAASGDEAKSAQAKNVSGATSRHTCQHASN